MNRYLEAKANENSAALRVGGWLLRLVRCCCVRKDRRVALRLTALGRSLRYATSACPTCSSNAALMATRQHDFAIIRHTVTGWPNLTLLGSAGIGIAGLSRFAPSKGYLNNRHFHHVFLNPTLSGCLYQQIKGRLWESQKLGHNTFLSLGVSHSVSRFAGGMEIFMACCMHSFSERLAQPPPKQQLKNLKWFFACDRAEAERG